MTEWNSDERYRKLLGYALQHGVITSVSIDALGSLRPEGMFFLHDQKIVLNSDTILDPEQAVLVLSHEIGHAVLHRSVTDFGPIEVSTSPGRYREEILAWRLGQLLLRHLGILPTGSVGRRFRRKYLASYRRVAMAARIRGRWTGVIIPNAK